MLLFPVLLLSLFSFSLSAAGAPPAIERMWFVDFVAPVHAGGPADATCGSSNSYRTSGVKWTDFPVSYVINANGVNGVAAAAAEQAVVNAFNTWDAEQHGGATQQKVFFAAAGGATPDVTVTWVSIDGPGGILAQAGVWYYVTTKAIVSATIEFDADDSWVVLAGEVCYGKGAGGDFDIENVAAHEIGHVIGLGHPASNPKNRPLTMFAYATPGETYKTSLAAGDKKGIAALYPS